MISDKEIKDIFFNLEKDKSIFNYQINGVSIYFILRFNLEMHLRSLSLSKNKKQSFFSRVLSKAKQLSKKVNPTIIESNFFDSDSAISPSPYLFVGTCAWKNEEGANVDLYDIIKYYHSQGKIINFVQPKYAVNSLPIKSIYYSSFLPLNNNPKTSLPKKDVLILIAFLKKLNSELDIDFISKLEAYTINISTVLHKANELENYIIKSGAKYIFVRSLYTEPWVAIACFKTGAKLIEVQHGVVSPDNIYYQSVHPKTDLKDGSLLMPDYILTLGSEWRDILIRQQSFYDNTNVFNLGTLDYDLETNIIDTNNIKLVFFLQGRGFNQLLSITDFIAEFIEAYKNEIKSKNIELIIRPHPNDLAETEVLKNHQGYFSIEDTNKIEAVDSIKKNNFIISATSMCLYEALAYGKTAISFSQFVGMVTNKEHIKFITSKDDLFKLIEEYRKYPTKTIPYLNSFNSKVLEKFK